MEMKHVFPVELVRRMFEILVVRRQTLHGPATCSVLVAQDWRLSDVYAKRDRGGGDAGEDYVMLFLTCSFWVSGESCLLVLNEWKVRVRL
jgi:hypothetical protein